MTVLSPRAAVGIAASAPSLGATSDVTCVATLHGAVADFDRLGFARVPPSFLLEDGSGDEEACQAFLASCRDLPPDPYAAPGIRYRRYGRFVLQPGTLQIEPELLTFDRQRGSAVTPYVQSAANNPEHAGVERRFGALLPEQVANPFLLSAIARCFVSSSWHNDAAGVVVGVHIVRTTARPNSPGVSTPDHLHHDGEPINWAFLLSRFDVAGGENVIASPGAAGLRPEAASPSDILVRFTLDQPLSGWVVDDRRVSHYVSPVTVASGAAIGERTILLIDFSPDSGASL